MGRRYFYGVVFKSLERLNNGYIIGIAVQDSNLQRGIVSFMKVDFGGNIYAIKNYPPNILRNYYVSDVKKRDSRLFICYQANSLNDDTIHGSVYLTDTNGSVLKENEFTEATYTEFLNMLPLANGDLMLVGNTNILYENSENAYVVRVDSNLYAPPVGIKNESGTISSKYKFLSNFPNPFNNSTIIEFNVPKLNTIKLTTVKIIICDLTGRLIAIPVNATFKPGVYNYIWSTENFASGIYFCKIYFDNLYTDCRKMVLLK